MKDDSENIMNQNIIENNINSQIQKKTRNDFGLNNNNNKFNFNLGDGNTEEEIIFPTNTCFDEQSFFIMPNQSQSNINKNNNDNVNNDKINIINKNDDNKINKDDLNINNKNINSVSSISNINSMNSIKNITSINSIINSNIHNNIQDNIHNNNKHASNKSELTKISNDIISDIFGINNHNHKSINNNYNNLNYDDLVFLQNSSPTSSEIMKNKKIVQDFILRNNYVKKREEKNEENENNNTMKTNLTNNANINNNNMKRNDSAITFQNFLNRKKRFENKRFEFKEKK
jgi:hypothetical protein